MTTPTARPLEQLAIAAFGASTGETDGAKVLTRWAQLGEETRVDFRAIADAVRMMLDMPSAEPQPAPELAAAMAETRKMRDIVCKLLDLYGAPDGRMMQHSSVTRATLRRYASDAGVRLDGLPS